MSNFDILPLLQISQKWVVQIAIIMMTKQVVRIKGV